MPGKTILETPQARAFVDTMDALSRKKYAAMLALLAEHGFLSAPAAEKVTGEENLFALRILTRNNYRCFYCYDDGVTIFVLSGYSKRSEQIPRREIDKANNIKKELGL